MAFSDRKHKLTILFDYGKEGIYNLGCRGIAENERVDGCRRYVSNTASHALSCVFKHDFTRVRMVGKLSFDDNAQSAKLKEHIGTMPTVNVNGLRVGGYTQTGYENCELGVYNLFAVPWLFHGVKTLL